MCHVLLIEDEMVIGLNLQLLLEENGADSVELVDTEQEAVSAAQRRRPDLIMSDMTLRVGTGQAAVEEIRRSLGAVPVIFITATPSACTVQEECRVFAKPIDENAIARAFREMAFSHA